MEFMPYEGSLNGFPKFDTIKADSFDLNSWMENVKSIKTSCPKLGISGRG